MKGDLVLVGGPADGLRMHDVGIDAKLVTVRETEAAGLFTADETAEALSLGGLDYSVYRVVDFTYGPDRHCNARFAIHSSMDMFQGIALLARHYRPNP